MKTMLSKIKEELMGFTTKERRFIFFAMFTGFFINAEYAIIRPTTTSIFVAYHNASWIPYSWLFTLPINLALVSFYNRYLPKFGCMKMFMIITWGIVGVNFILAKGIHTVPFFPFIFYAWKEIYVVLMFQQLWSVIHATIPKDRAKYLYGLLFGIGGLGGACASAMPGFFAVSLGSEIFLFVTLPLYAVANLFYYGVVKNSDAMQRGDEMDEKKKTSFIEGAGLISKSQLLTLILILVLCMQVATSFVDYQYSDALAKAFPEQDMRTQQGGKVQGLINLCTVLSQFLGAFFAIHFLGLRKSHFVVPALVLINACAFFFFPGFPVAALSFITIKSLDFSLFGVIKEMLYLPVATEAKFRAKSIIDVFVYRGSKAVASVMILFLNWRFIRSDLWIQGVLIAIAFTWVYFIYSRFHAYETAIAAYSSKTIPEAVQD